MSLDDHAAVLPASIARAPRENSAGAALAAHAPGLLPRYTPGMPRRVSAGPRRHGPDRRDTRPLADANGASGHTRRPIRVLVVDDHAIVREGIASVLDSDARLAVVGEAGDGIEALELLPQLCPDVVLVDVNMPRMNGIETTREIRSRWPEIATVGLSVQSDPPTSELMREAGAAGFIPKSGDSDQMIAMILSVAAQRTPDTEPPADS